ncbi:Superoxide dismutase [Mn], mitochondrial [Pyricularia oryzae]|nr:Superoxide dismutase [Mn], mitochondrial [Pyricularia oryzae]KAI6285382.1 Superoxide dismutase [Mn], mitochondrial [Pyricularia oryzae]KAI6361617.1 Superoxide dismutase [Mn], mitochondrial [Pyricularia oryzae]KAI6418169.1 Superoxide dismutase [Mn], mitochondrial [Pyricularia oryzae]KAI6451172.1 Superoxide dismutase [Mn], mitochondrial [Pyricularia oryzae]
MASSTTYKLPELPFAYDALEPHISKQIMELHHSKHHAAYVTNLNKALETYASGQLADRVATLAAINFNAGGHINHTLFWENLTPASSPDADAATSAPSLVSQIEKQWGSLDQFKAEFSAELLGIKGSGWGWLVKEKSAAGALVVVTTKDQDSVPSGIPVFGVDMWEHAYYLQYLNGKAAYVENIWKVINWKTAEKRFASPGRSEVFKALHASL